MVALLPATRETIADLDERLATEFAGGTSRQIVGTLQLYDEIGADPHASAFPILLEIAAAVNRAGTAEIDRRADFCRSKTELT